MKRLVLLVLLVGLVALLLSLACASREKIDVVNGVPPVSDALSSIAPTLDAMGEMPPDQRGAYLEQNWPHLDEGVVYFLRDKKKLARNDRVDRVEFLFGSLNKVTAESGDGRNRHGYFEDQLVALVYVRGQSKPIKVIVHCLNGIFSTEDDLKGLQAVGSHTPMERFTIGPREGLIHHVDFPVAIDLAERFRLPLYRGKDMNPRNRITPDQARALENTTDRLQVTVYVVQGDRFDLAADTFTPSPRRRG